MRNTINETTAQTIDHLLEQRRIQREQEEREAQRQRDQDADDRTVNAIVQLAAQLAQRLSETTRAGLSLDYDFHRDDDDHEIEYAFARFENAGQQWTIRYRHGWHLAGPNGYDVLFAYAWNAGGEYTGDALLDSRLLDALDGYPAWIEKKREPAQGSAKKPSRRPTPHYDFAEGDGGDGRGEWGILHTGAHISVFIVPATQGEYEEKQVCYTGTLDDWSERWILLTCDSSKTQRLIPMHRVDEIQPELPYEPTESEETERPKTRDISAIRADFAAEAAAVRLREERAGAAEAAEYQGRVPDDIPF